MAWTDIFPIMIRTLIGDLGITQTYTDDQLNQAAAVAAVLVAQEYPFTTTYTIDLSLPNISPDPTVAPDNNAVALWSLKAACILNTNAFQSALGAGIRVRDGSSQVDTTGGLSGYSELLKIGPCAAYASLVKLLIVRLSMGQGRAVMGPTSHGMALWGNSGVEGNFSARGFFDYFLRY